MLVELMLESWHLLEPEVSRWRGLLQVPYQRYKITGAIGEIADYQACNTPRYT